MGYRVAPSAKLSKRRHVPRATCLSEEDLPENGTFGALGAVWHKNGTSQKHQMSAGAKGMSPAYRTLGHVAHVLLHVRPPGGHFCSKRDHYMTFLDGLRLSIRGSRDRRSVGWRTGALGRVTTWRTCSLGVLRGEDILPLSENSIFCTFCIFSWPKIANGGIGRRPYFTWWWSRQRVINTCP